MAKSAVRILIPEGCRVRRIEVASIGCSRTQGDRIGIGFHREHNRADDVRCLIVFADVATLRAFAARLARWADGLDFDANPAADSQDEGESYEND